MRGYKAISEWGDDLSPKVLRRFGVRRRNGQYRPPSLSAMRSLLIRVNPVQLDAALRDWHEAHGWGDSTLAIDGKTIRRPIDYDGKQAAARLLTATVASVSRRGRNRAQDPVITPQRQPMYEHVSSIGTIPNCPKFGTPKAMWRV